MERYSHPTANPKAKLIGISTHSLLIKSNFQDFQRYQPIDLDITGDGQATLPYLIEAVKKALPSGHNAAFDGRAEKMKEAHKKSKEQARLAASYGWDATPISTARMCAEVWPLIKDSDWALTAGTLNFMNNWPLKLWDVTKHYQYGGGTGGGGVGYGAPAGVGSALAHREHGRLVVAMWGDGDLMCCSGALWTAAHHKIPLVAIVHNNRAYHQELMHVQRWPIGISAESIAHGSERRFRIRRSTLPKSRKALASRGSGLSSIPTISGRRSRKPSRSPKPASRCLSMSSARAVEGGSP